MRTSRRKLFVGISPTEIASPPIPVRTFACDGEGRANWSTSEVVWGTVTFAADADELTIVNMARGLGDCGYVDRVPNRRRRRY
ncbi:MAG TPA: hypothetical protein VF456_28725 [Vicinamibacterales bacterium]